MGITVAILAGVLLFAFPFVIYPVLLAMVTARRQSQASPTDDNPQELPTMALVICALNEQSVIGSKMENCLALEYPQDKLRIIVISDGSTDRTAEIVRKYPRVELIERKTRRGKIANLNDVLPTCTEDILALSDANVMYKSDALLQLASRFADPNVGCVSGKVILTGSTDVLDQPTGQYYSLEWSLQEKSSQLYSMAGADGAMYALRRELFRSCPNDTIIEDFVIPMQVVQQGKRVVFEPNAIAWEPGVTSLQEDFRRRIRIGAGSAQGLLRGNVWPKNAPYRFWFVFIAHKLLRWLSPVIGFMLVLLCAATFDQPLSATLIVGTGVLAALAFLRLLTGWDHPIFSAPFFFLFMQVALAIGLLKGARGQQSVLWVKADR